MASIEQPAMAIRQSPNEANANPDHDANANGPRRANGVHGEDAQKAGNGVNGGSNILGGGCGRQLWMIG